MRTLQLDDFYKYKFLSGLEYNKSGSLAAVIRAEPDVENNGYKKNLYLFGKMTNTFSLPQTVPMPRKSVGKAAICSPRTTA